MKNKLKTLSEYNKTASVLHSFDFSKPQLNGIACPKCGEELFDSNPMITLTSNPPQKDVNCSKCNYIGYRIA